VVIGLLLFMQSILEDPAVTKLMFDLRSDSAQLSREYGVRLRGAYDLQLAEVATRQLANVVAQWVLPLDKVRRHKDLTFFLTCFAECMQFKPVGLQLMTHGKGTQSV
jgi:hypothetical protein